MTDHPEDAQIEVSAPLSRVRRFILLFVIASGVTGIIGVGYWQVNSLYTDQALIKIADMASDNRAMAATGGLRTSFDLSNAIIPVHEIFSGGPPKDGIPAILHPKFIAADTADFLSEGDLVIGMEHNGVAKAYPLRIIIWHEIVNDTIADLPVAVTYCPLCGTSMVFDRRVGGEEYTFGVSGLLYHSDVLMYDHQTDSLWSQLMMQSIAGQKVSSPLTWLVSEEMAWGAWRERHPETLVLSKDTGYERNYDGTAYASYMKFDGVMFPVPRTREELPQREWVMGIIVDGVAKAYPIDALQLLNGEPLLDRIGSLDVTIIYDESKKWPSAMRTDTKETLPHVRVYWFAWQAFYPETQLYTP